MKLVQSVRYLSLPLQVLREEWWIAMAILEEVMEEGGLLVQPLQPVQSVTGVPGVMSEQE
uniref:Uncharacterized protein n=1 Tax=Oryza nivara TaxID=4536 RepID=A0A0E0J8P8_ORYNI